MKDKYLFWYFASFSVDIKTCGWQRRHKPERNRWKTADGWSFPARAASPPRRSSRSSSRKPFGRAHDQVTHTHTHTPHLLREMWAAATRTGRKRMSGTDIFFSRLTGSHAAPNDMPLISHTGCDLVSFMETMFTCTEVTAFRGRHLLPFPGVAGVFFFPDTQVKRRDPQRPQQTH